MNHRVHLLSVTLVALALASGSQLAGCGVGDPGGGEGEEVEASDAVEAACEPATRKLDEAIVASGCESNFDLLLKGCHRNGARAEAAGCLAEFETEKACEAEQAATCTCDDGVYGCGLPCVDEKFATDQCEK